MGEVAMTAPEPVQTGTQEEAVRTVQKLNHNNDHACTHNVYHPLPNAPTDLSKLSNIETDNLDNQYNNKRKRHRQCTQQS